MKKTVVALFVMLSFLLSVQQGFAEKSGTQLVLHYGIVQSAEVVQLDSEAAKEALFSGAVGLWSANGKEQSKKWCSTLAGAVKGGVLEAGSEGDRRGVEYEVNVDSRYTIKIISDQSEIRVGDCVIVEQSEKSINIRREPSAVCRPESQEAVRNLRKEFEEEANECLAAKQQLLDSESDQDVDTASLKMQILCNN